MIYLSLPEDAIRSTLLTRGMVQVSTEDALSAFRSDDWDGVIVAVRRSGRFNYAMIPQSIAEFEEVNTKVEWFIGPASAVQPFTPENLAKEKGHDVICTVNLDNRTVEFLDTTIGHLVTQSIAGVRVQVTKSGETTTLLENHVGTNH